MTIAGKARPGGQGEKDGRNRKNRSALGSNQLTAGNDEAEDRRWMRRALSLARRGRGSTRPNPMVGAVLVRDGRLCAEGFHLRSGEPHAEINALARLARTSGKAAGATLYVTLEPCCHVGRTAPCTAALVAARLSRVVVGVRDPNPLVDGRGISRLRRAGIRVQVGCLEQECRDLNRPFFTWVSQGRPLITLKAAATLDGFIAPRAAARGGKAAPVWITGPRARAAGHALRAEHDAILVGAGTVAADDPRLTVRVGKGQRRSRGSNSGTDSRAGAFLRVVLDGKLSISPTAQVLAPVGETRTLVLGGTGASPARARALRAAGAEVELLPARQGVMDLRDVVRALAARNVQSLLVEGGASVHAGFITAGLVDRVVFFFAPLLAGGGVPIAAGPGLGLPFSPRLGPLTVVRLGQDLLIRADVQSVRDEGAPPRRR